MSVSFLKWPCWAIRQPFTPLLTPVRTRYHEEKMALKGIYRFGNEDKIKRRGLMPRSSEFRAYPIVEYRPSNSWSAKKVKFGCNDYIDILGNEKFRPSDVHYDTPKWLRGFQGNELQMLLHRIKTNGPKLDETHPRKYKDVLSRFMYLYYKLNYKVKISHGHKDRFK